MAKVMEIFIYQNFRRFFYPIFCGNWENFHQTPYLWANKQKNVSKILFIKLISK
jgi:hypothetical protein